MHRRDCLRAGLGLLLAPAVPAAETVIASESVEVGGGRIPVVFAGDTLKAQRKLLLEWVRYSAVAVADYYGRLPVPQVQLALIEEPGQGVLGGRAFGGEQPAINVRIGSRIDAELLRADWVLVHELIHMALPQMPRRHHWLEEGLSVYVESLARVHAGHLSEEFVWRGFIKGMRHGLPRAGDRGLDNTPSWGRTYWGGAIFCLLADIEIRRRSNQRMSLRDALRGLLIAGLDMRRKSNMAAVIRAADRATGLPVFAETYALMAEQPQPEKLEPLWHALGVSLQAGELRYDERAPRARMRRALLARPL